MDKNTFVCPGMVVKLPYKLGDKKEYTHSVVVEVFRSSVDMKNLYTGNIYPIDIASLRERGILVGYNYREK